MSRLAAFLTMLPLLAASQALAPPRASADAETWLFNGSANSWTASSGTTLTPTSQHLHIVFATGGALFSAPFSFVPASGVNHNYIRFGYRITDGAIAQFRFNFQTSARPNYSSQDYFMPVIHDGAWRWVTFPVDQIGDWRASNVTQMRFIALGSGGGGASGTMDLDFVVLRLDDRVPDAPSSVTPAPGGWTNGPFTVAVEANDPPPNGFSGSTPPDIYGSGVATFRWWIGSGSTTTVPYDSFDQVGGTTYVTISVPTNASGMAPGPNTFRVQTHDRVGFVGSSTPATLYYDPTAPNQPGTPSVSPSGWASTQSFSFSWNNPGDSYSGVAYYQGRVDGGTSFDIFGESVSGVFVGQGSHGFDVRAIDGAGNVGPWSPSVAFQSDISPPTVPSGLTVSPAGFTNVNNFTFNWGASTDALSGLAGYQYRLNSGDPIYNTGALSVSGVTAPREGSNHFEVRSYDVAGNASAWAGIDFFYYPNYLFPPVVQAPANGTAISLPETFSWSSVPNATGYEIQVSPDPNFAANVWSTTTTAVTSVSVPAAAAPSAGQGYAWRVRALGSDPPGNWSSTATFIRVSSVAVPGAPALLSPADGATHGDVVVVFQWSGVSAATSYRLEVSTASDFSSGAGTSWLGEGLTGTSKAVEFGSVAIDLYWRVTARNSAGYGASSPVRLVHLSPAQTGIASATVLAPSTDLTVDEGQPLLATGLVVGRSSGVVTAEWLFDGNVIASQTIPLSGTGVETDPIPVPTSTIGPHTLHLRVTDISQVLSPPRTITVATPGFGPADHLALVADVPQLLAGTSTALYSTVRDADEALILNDSGRPLHFDAAGNGAVSPTDAVTAGGVATVNYIAPQNETDPQVTVTDETVESGSFRTAAGPGTRLNPAAVQMGVSNTELRRQQRIAYGYLDRLRVPSWLGIPGPNLQPNAWPPIPFRNLSRIYTWVDTRQVGDLGRLRRLNLYLRFVDRAFGYEESVVPTTPREPGRIFGAATLFADQANSWGRIGAAILSTVSKLTVKADKLSTWNPLKGVYKRAISALGSLCTFLVNTAIDFSGASAYEKSLLRGAWMLFSSLIQSGLISNPSGTIEYIVLNSGLTNRMAQGALDGGFTRPVQIQLDRVFDTVSNPGWSGGSDARAEAAVTNALAETRNKSFTYHNGYAKTVSAFGLEQFISDLHSILGTFNPIFFAGVVLNKTIKSLILWAAGTDCATIAHRIPGLAANVANEVLAFQGPRQVVPARLMKLEPMFGPPDREFRSAPLALGPGLQRALQQASASTEDFEAIARELELALEASDTSAVRVAIEALEFQSPAIDNGALLAGSALHATAESARLTIPDFKVDGDSLTGGPQESGANRFLAISAASDWLADPTNESLRQTALASLRLSIEDTRGTMEQLIDYVPTLIGQEGLPYLVLEKPVGPDAVLMGQTVRIEVRVTNLGAATATNAALALGQTAGIRDLEDGPLRLLGDLEPGESRTVAWVFSAIPPLDDQDSTGVMFLSIAPDTESVPGNAQLHAMMVSRVPPVAVDGGSGPPSALSLAIPFPNPSRGSTAFRFVLPQASPVTIDITDTSGRRVRTMNLGDLPAGSHVHSWDGLLERGTKAPAGIYLATLRSASGKRAVRVIRLH